MINVIDILQESHSGYFTSQSGEKSAGLFCVIAYHQKIVVELREYSFYTFSEAFINPGRRSPVLLAQPNIEKILLYLSTEISFISKHHAIMILPFHIFEIMEVMNTGYGHIAGMNYTSYTTDSVMFISIIMQSLRCAVAPIGSCIRIVLPHDATFGSCVLADLDRFRVYTESILGSINSHCHILADFLCKSGRQLTTGIELPPTNQVWQIVLTLIMQTMEQKIFAVEAQSLCRYAKSNDFEVGKIGNNTTSGYIPELVNTILGEFLADFEYFGEFCYGVAHKQSNSIQRFKRH